jgi:hypothetical protein
MHKPNNNTRREAQTKMQEQSANEPGPATHQWAKTWADEVEMLDTQPVKISKNGKEELLKESQSAIKNLGSTRKWLLENNHAVEGEAITISLMVMALLCISSSQLVNVKDMINGTRAVAIYLEEIGKEE